MIIGLEGAIAPDVGVHLQRACCSMAARHAAIAQQLTGKIKLPLLVATHRVLCVLHASVLLKGSLQDVRQFRIIFIHLSTASRDSAACSYPHIIRLPLITRRVPCESKAIDFAGNTNLPQNCECSCVNISTMLSANDLACVCDRTLRTGKGEVAHLASPQ